MTRLARINTNRGFQGPRVGAFVVTLAVTVLVPSFPAHVEAQHGVILPPTAAVPHETPSSVIGLRPHHASAPEPLPIGDDLQ